MLLLCAEGVLPGSQDYSKACPASWVKDLDSVCVAPETYSGTCVGRKSFVGFAASEKKAWGQYPASEAHLHIAWLKCVVEERNAE